MKVQEKRKKMKQTISQNNDEKTNDEAEEDREQYKNSVDETINKL